MENLKHADKLKKENDRAQSKIKLLMKSCKQLEEEKVMLQKELSHLEAAQELKQVGASRAHIDKLWLAPTSDVTYTSTGPDWRRLVTSHWCVCAGSVVSALFVAARRDWAVNRFPISEFCARAGVINGIQNEACI